MPSFLDMLQDPNVLLTFDKVQNPLRLPCETTSERPKVLRTRQFLHFWLRYVLRATMACTFSTFQLPKVVRDHQSLTRLTSKCASRHNGVHFFTSHLARWLRTRRFSEPTFRPSGATNHWKNTVNSDFSIFSRTCIFFLLTLSLDSFSSLILSSSLLFLQLFPPLLFHLSMLSEVWLLKTSIIIRSAPTLSSLHVLSSIPQLLQPLLLSNHNP